MTNIQTQYYPEKAFVFIYFKYPFAKGPEIVCVCVCVVCCVLSSEPGERWPGQLFSYTDFCS